MERERERELHVLCVYVVNGTNEDNPEMRTPLCDNLDYCTCVCACVREREFTALLVSVRRVSMCVLVRVRC